jgi:hypothetical protein
VNLDEIHQFVLGEIDSYRNEVSADALGRAFGDEKVERLLSEMRAALVEPKWETVVIRDTPEGPPLDPHEQRRCMLVADALHQLYYDPSEDEFFLADDGGSIGVWGDAVGCFMAQ